MRDLSMVEHHPAIEDITDLLCNKTQNRDRGFFRVEAAYYLGKIASSMRVVINTKDRGEIPVNIYALALATSGFGKGHSVNIIETQLLAGFKKRFMEDTFPVISEQHLYKLAVDRAIVSGNDEEDEKAKLDKEFMQAGSYPFTFDSGTGPAVKQLRQKLLLAQCGSINLQIDEIGSNLVGNVEVLNVYLELYDQGMIKPKLIKNTADNVRSQDMDGKTPANMLLFGTPAKLFDGSKTEEEFYSFLETGYARRCLFGWGEHERTYDELTPAEIYKKLIDPQNSNMINKWLNHFTLLADASKFGWQIDVEDVVGIELLTYKIECEKLAEAMSDHEEIRKAEMSHRYFKVLKLAGAFAFVDETTEITMDQLYAAIKLVEESGQNFQRLLTREKTYVKLAKYIAAMNVELTHADLHEALPFYKLSKGQRNELMDLARGWGYKQHIVIKKTFNDGIEFFSGETLEETDLNKLMVSYSDHFAYNYLHEAVPFDNLHVLTQAEGPMHWTNHNFKSGHRAEENVIPGFNMIVLDIDGDVPINTVHDLMKEYVFMTYTTKRHTEETNRFRLVIPINYRLNLDQEDYREFMNNIMEWLPFTSDESSNQRSKKWETCSTGSHFYHTDGEILDALQFVPKTTKNEQYQQTISKLENLDNVERWFAQRIATGNRNNQLIKYALLLVDSGLDYNSVEDKVISFNSRLSNGLSETELRSTILQTVAKKVSVI